MRCSKWPTSTPEPSATDLSVKVPGGAIEAARRYYGNAWHFEHTRHHLVLKPAVIGTGIESIDKAGVTYAASALDSDLFLHDTYRIAKTATGFRWEDKSGGFKEFDAEGRMLSYGGRNGVIGRLSYAGGRLAGVSDRNNLPVLWYEWAGERISSVRDKANRRVDYDWSNGRLNAVTDPTGAITRFEYDGKGRVSKAIDAEGREVAIGYDDYGRVASVHNALGKGQRFEYDYDESRQELYARMQTAAGLLKEIWFDKHDEIKRVDLNGRTLMKIQKDGRHLIITDERGEITRKEYDERDNLTRGAKGTLFQR